MSTFRELNFTVSAQLKGIKLIEVEMQLTGTPNQILHLSCSLSPTVQNTIQYNTYKKRWLRVVHICEWVDAYIFKLWYSTVHKDTFDAEESRGTSLRLI